MAFTIVVSPDGPGFSCLENQTVLDAALSNNLNLSYGCRSGLCTSCKGKVLEGNVKGNFETLVQEKEAGLVLFCQAVPLSDLVIEVQKRAVDTAVEVSNFPARVIGSVKNKSLDIKIPSNESFSAKPGQKCIVSAGSTKVLFEVAELTEQKQSIKLCLSSSPEKASLIWSASLVQIQGPFG